MFQILLLVFSLNAWADTKITDLPLGSAAGSGVNDVFPFVDVTGPTTKKMKLSDLKNLPSFSTFNAATASALASFPAQCPATQFATGIAANGDANCAVPAGGGGSSGLTVSSISASATLVVGSPVNYQHVACSATGGNVVATLPACAGNVGQVFNLKKVDASSNTCGFARTGADLIDGQISISTDQQYTGVSVVCRAAGIWDVL